MNLSWTPDDRTQCPACDHTLGIHLMPRDGTKIWQCFAKNMSIDWKGFLKDWPLCGCTAKRP